ncbi:MAG: DUF6265 family protein, partial [Thermoanaerobaculia bacterium]|nr:DUF6265 family protein [Thermoanaerobaculia bacterium]
LTGWEEKDDFVSFRLVKVEEGVAYFHGLTYRRVGDDQLRIFLAMRQGGELREVDFSLRRVPAASRP